MLFVLHSLGPDHLRLMSVDAAGKLTPRMERYTANAHDKTDRVPTMAVLSPDGKVLIVGTTSSSEQPASQQRSTMAGRLDGVSGRGSRELNPSNADERSDHEIQQAFRPIHLRSHDSPVYVFFRNGCRFGGGQIYRKEKHEAVTHVRPSRPCKRSGETAAPSRSPFLGRDCLVRPHRRKRSRHFQENGSYMGADSQ